MSPPPATLHPPAPPDLEAPARAVVPEVDLSAWRGRSILVAMSGGVDSSLAAVLLHEAGARVVGVHMRTHRAAPPVAGASEGASCRTRSCCSPADSADARRVADRAGFPYHAMDFEADFRRAVVEPFVDDYLAGLTPNPCVGCNNRLKLGTLLAKARALGCEAVATGHYARVLRDPATGRTRLSRAADASKDQTYYLFGLAQPQLERLVTPLGDLTKEQVRRMARERGMHLADKPDSQEICFIPDDDYRRFLREDAGIDEDGLAGDVVDASGRVLGRHRGVHEFTVGQRRGIGIASDRPLYVVELRPATRTVVVGGEDEVFSREARIERVNLVGASGFAGPARVRARIRHRHEPAPATFLADGEGGGRVVFDEPQRAVTPGQACVLYDEPDAESVLAGGWIARDTAGDAERRERGER